MQRILDKLRGTKKPKSEGLLVAQKAEEATELQKRTAALNEVNTRLDDATKDFNVAIYFGSRGDSLITQTERKCKAIAKERDAAQKAQELLLNSEQEESEESKSEYQPPVFRG
jgi:hypothetical protein